MESETGGSWLDEANRLGMIIAPVHMANVALMLSMLTLLGALPQTTHKSLRA